MSDTNAPAPDLGVLERGRGEVTLRFTRPLPHPPGKVWRALTEPEHQTAWFPTALEGDYVPGAALRFTFRGINLPALDGTMARDAAGWHTCLDLLGYDLTGEPAPWSQDARWPQVHRNYVRGFGPEAATVGPPAEWEDTYGPASGEHG